jgi:hypothetical protein
MLNCPTEYYEAKRQNEEVEDPTLVRFSELCEATQKNLIENIAFDVSEGKRFSWSPDGNVVRTISLEEIEDEALFDDSIITILQLLYKGQTNKAEQLANSVKAQIMFDEIKQALVDFNRAPDGYDIDLDSLSIVKIGE